MDINVKDCIKLQQVILQMDKPQFELALTRSCAGICKINYALRTSLVKSISNSINKYDNSLRKSLEKFANPAWMKTRDVRLLFLSEKVV